MLHTHHYRQSIGIMAVYEAEHSFEIKESVRKSVKILGLVQNQPESRHHQESKNKCKAPIQN